MIDPVAHLLWIMVYLYKLLQMAGNVDRTILGNRIDIEKNILLYPKLQQKLGVNPFVYFIFIDLIEI